ncbi:MAG: hypothetical protein MJ252_23215, partial [archaeon]|nr:hypothetical protein [archaeon]
MFNFNSFQDIDKFDTFDNPKGMCSISYDPSSTIIAFPDRQGCVRVKSYNENNFSTLINAHESNVTQLVLNYDGTMLATSSDKGTLIRIFNSQKGDMLQEVRRGKDKAIIYCLNFDFTGKLLICSSDKGTIHIWSLINGYKKLKEDNENLKEEDTETKEENIPQNNESFFKKLPGFFMGGFFKSEWSFGKMRIEDENKTLCCFGENN